MKFRNILCLLLVFAMGIGFLPAPALAAAKPDAPVVVLSNDAATGAVKLTWNAVEGAKLYRVYRSETKSGGYSRIKSTSSTRYTDTSAPVGQTLYYLVKSVSDSGGVSSSSNKVSGAAKVPADKIHPPVVTASNLLSTGEIRLKWEAVKGAKHYRIYRSKTKTGGFSLIKSTSSTAYTDSSASAGTAWYYCIKTVSTDGTVSDSSGKVSAIAKLPRPTVTLSNITQSGKIRVSWTAVEGAQKYEVYRATSKSGSYRLIKTTSATAMTNTSTTAGKKYYYQVKAIAENPDASSALSSAKSRTCKLAQPVITLTNAASGRITLSWEAIEGTTEYKVYRSTSSGSGYSRVKVTTATRYTDTTGTAGTTYYYKVMAASDVSGASSAYSQVLSGTFAYPDGMALSISVNEDGKPYLTWNNVKNAASYRVFRSYQKDIGFSLLSTRTVCYYTNPSAPAGVPLFYQVKALDADGKVLETSDAVSITLDLPEKEVLKDRYAAVPSLKLYTVPNVASDAVTLRYRDAVQLGAAVISGTGSTWHRVFLEGKLYYMRTESGEEKLMETASTVYTGNSPYQQQTIDLALEICNNWKTVYATGQSEGIPNADGACGFNSPGFVKYVLNTVMQPSVPTYRLSVSIDALYAADSLYNAGYIGAFRVSDVKPANIQPGDVLFFGTTEPSYCGIYLGNEEFVYATSSWEDAVCIMPLSGSFRENLLAVRRYLPETVTPAEKTAYIVGPYYTYNLYVEMNSSSRVVKTLTQYDRVTLLFTNSDNWAYIRTADGTEGFFLLEHLGEYEYLDHLTVSAVLNEEGKPYISWNKVNNAAAYEVYRSLRSDSGFELLATTENTFYSNLSAPDGLTLYYQLRALDASGQELDLSAPVSVTTELAAPETLETRYVYVPLVNLYDLPETGSEPLSLRYMEQLQLGLPVIRREDGTWYRCFYRNRLYYLWLTSIEETLTTQKSSFTYTGNTPYQQDVIGLALEISENWSTVYAHEQSDGIPNADGNYGFDCSGLVSYIFNTVMQKTVPTYRLYSALDTLYATTGIYNAGYPGAFSAADVPDGQLQPGDILFFTSLADGTASTEIGHCGIYLGNNEFVHSTSSWSDAVCIMRLSGSYLENYVGARRYLPETVIPANTEKSIVGPYYSYNLYSERNSASAVLEILSRYDPVTVLFTDNDTWAYVRTESGTEGYLLMDNLGEYTYLDHVVLSAQLNEDGKPYLTWNKVQSAVSYEVHRSLQKDTGYSLLSATENTYYTNATIPSGMTLYYQVKALDASGNVLDTSDAVSLVIPLPEPEVLKARYVTESSVKLYTLPDTASGSITLRYMDLVQLGSNVTSSWYRVFRGDDLYYIWMPEGDSKLTDTGSAFSYAGETALQQEVLDLAMDICLNWNTIYATGQSDGIANPDGTFGFNSPGLVKYVFNAVMQEKVPFYRLPQALDDLYAAGGLYNAGYPGAFSAADVAAADLRPCDVLFFGSGSDTNYCGIYLGNGEFLYSSASWDDGVCVMPLSGFQDSLVKIRRYLPDAVTPANTEKAISGPYKGYKVYAEKSASSAVLATPAQEDTLTVLFTDNSSWAYVRTEDDVEGYFLLKYLP